MTTKPVAAGRRGRRPGANTTRQAILDAARARFAADGYAATTIRRVAADAEVDASLVMQFFRSKDELFGAVMSITPEALARLGSAFEGPDEHLGERVVRAFFDVWEGDPRDSEPLLAMLRGAVAEGAAKTGANEQLREFIQARLLDGIRSRPGDPDDAALRAGLAASMLVGIVVGRRIVGVRILTEADSDTLIARLAPAIQTVLTAAQE
ncbi:transcriptional regulator [Mycobacterium sp. 1482292.6]|uniref:TetR/AcrR family transcriptional regulator n=1 Tax=Mycobacterium sp. 1482292.6 TaxID=1834081 RepID=UPI0008021F85|nr:TetR family transcriptional regulator [Mycobacterium sp. 1482292.6]OBJ04972.1 transcriptional regulator [Mycobacterium sp. 1482292.6]